MEGLERSGGFVALLSKLFMYVLLVFHVSIPNFRRRAMERVGDGSVIY